MSDIAIRVEGLGKRYRIGKRQASYGTLRESLAETFTAPFKRFRRNDNGHLTSDLRPPTSGDSIWALKDVSFEVKRGDVVGIIGRNGAGKSTLLKVLSRITEPTTGAVDIYGRVGSLLEVGTGFHPELTGRENIYLNGAILGMKKTEIASKFDEIVAFAEIERFIDTPVKHFSSGMYVRLAFAVAAHLEPEILVVDEVLAVGDAQFQKKCLGKIEDVTQKEGRTVLFVSHNIETIRSLCGRVLILESGNIVIDGTASEAIIHYTARPKAESWDKAPIIERLQDCHVKTISFGFNGTDGIRLEQIYVDTPFLFEIEYEVLSTTQRPVPSLALLTPSNEIICQLFQTSGDITAPGRYISKVLFPPNFLNDREYVLQIGFATLNPQYTHCVADYSFVVHDSFDAPTRGSYRHPIHGHIRPFMEWTTYRQVERP